MIPIPSPLHPAIVHFPIVLILLGTFVAVIAAFIKRWHLPWFSAGLLMLGALGAIGATWSGGEDEERAENLSPQADKILEEHEEWGERTRNVAIAAAVLGVAALVTASRFPKVARGLSAATALVAIGASYCVAETGHYGGLLVYKHGAGVDTATGVPAQRAAED
ncbi:MAG: hypothetical protein CFE26_07425 [Verrucomicrobiales bacterium VVV1]|nr:MAG: hypothetical protein CFE26_07425 [Verrucomicrobiales bacterium VVV1]